MDGGGGVLATLRELLLGLVDEHFTGILDDDDLVASTVIGRWICYCCCIDHTAMGSWHQTSGGSMGARGAITPRLGPKKFHSAT